MPFGTLRTGTGLGRAIWSLGVYCLVYVRAGRTNTLTREGSKMNEREQTAIIDCANITLALALAYKVFQIQ